MDTALFAHCSVGTHVGVLDCPGEEHMTDMR